MLARGMTLWKHGLLGASILVAEAYVEYILN